MKCTMKMNTVRVALLGLCVLAAGAASAAPRYVGAKACGVCHKAEYADWQRSAHGKTMELLLAGKRGGAKHKAGLDPDKDYSKEENQPDKFKCFTCHTTGYKKESGFVSVESTPDLAGVGCEACHGPGSEFREIHKLKMLDFKRSETRAAGQTYASRGDKVCEKCHNETSPFVPSVDKKYVFDLKERLGRPNLNEFFHQINPLEGNHD